MKRVLLCLLAAISFVACVESEIDEAKFSRGLITDELVVGFDEGDTRIQLNELQKTVWNKGDVVSVFYKSYENLMWQFQGQTGDRSGVLKHVDGSVGEQVMSDVVIVYPYNSEYMVNLETKCVEAHMPATQQYHENSYDPAVNIMVACDDSRSFVLKNVCGWVKVPLTGNGESLKYIKLRGNNNEQIAGDITVDTDDALASFISVEGEAADDLSVSGGLEFEDSVIDCVTLDCKGVVLDSEAKNFYITLPPVSFKNGFTVEVVCDGYEPMVNKVSSKVNISRNHIKPLETINFNGSKSIIDSELELDYTNTSSADTKAFYQYCANWVYDFKDVPLGAPSRDNEGDILSTDIVTINGKKPAGNFWVSNYGNNEFYTGSSAYYGNVDWRPSAVRGGFAAAGMGDLSDDEILAKLKENTAEVYAAVLGYMYPEMTPDEYKKVVIKFYCYGPNKNYSFTFAVADKGVFEYVADSLTEL